MCLSTNGERALNTLNVNLPFECYQLENGLNKYTRRNCAGKKSDRSETKTLPVNKGKDFSSAKQSL